MAWTPISGQPLQYKTSLNVLASGYYLKFYQAGTTTAFNMATDDTGGTTLDKSLLDSSGYPTTDGTARFVPHVNQKYKIVLYKNGTDADADATGNAEFVIDNISQLETGFSDLWLLFSGAPTQTSSTAFTVDGDYTSTFYPSSVSGSRLKADDSSTLYDTVVSATYDGGTDKTTVNLETGGLTGSLSAVYTSMADVTSQPISTASIAHANVSAASATIYRLETLLNQMAVSVLIFGQSVNDGATDPTSAFSLALTYINTASPGTKTIYCPSGTYLFTGTAGDDTTVHGFHVPFTGRPINSDADGLSIVGDGRKTIMEANTSNMIICRWSDSDGLLANMHFKGNLTSEGVSVICSDETSTGLGTVDQSHNLFFKLTYEQNKIGMRFRASKSAGSTCFYNTVLKCHILFRQTASGTEGGTGIKFDWVSGDYSPPNRNEVISTHIGRVNEGVRIVVADTNTFLLCTFEGIDVGTTPNATPTAVQLDTNASSIRNRFIGCTGEGNTRDLWIGNATTEFSLCDFKSAGSTNVFPVGGLTHYHGGDAANVPQVIPALRYNESLGSLETIVGQLTTAEFEAKGYPFKITQDDGSGDEDVVYITPGNLDHKGGFAAGRHNTTYTAGGGHAIRSYANAVDSYVETVGHNVADTTRVITVHVLGSDRMAVDAIGNGYWDGTHDGSPADYAEYFEWMDGNTDDQDRVGLTVVSESGKIRLSRAGDSARDIIGVVSARPIIVGDSDSLGWQGKYITDDYGRRIGDDLNPDYDPDVKHKPRSERPEWSAIGLVGKLYVDKNQCVGDRWILLKEGEIDKPDLWLVR